MHRDLGQNTILSPMFIIFVTFGLFIMAAFPPLGILVAVLGYGFQRRFRSGHRAARLRAQYALQLAAARAEEQHRRNMIATARSLRA